jgi:hypothetical protein
MSFWEGLLSIFLFMALVAWIWLLIAILGDLFRDHELSGWSKALWTLLIIVFPWLGTLVYLIARGRSMNERALARARMHESVVPRYAHGAGVQPPTLVAELTSLAGMRDRGDITPQEFAQAKARLLGTQSPTTDAPQQHPVG